MMSFYRKSKYSRILTILPICINVCTESLIIVFVLAPEGKYRGMRDVLAELLRAGGLRELYRGLTPALLRAFPANAV